MSGERGQIESLNLLRIRVLGIDHLVQKTARFSAGGPFDQLAVHHQQGLRDGAVEGRGLVVFVGAEGDDELLQPFVALLLPGRPVGLPRVVRVGRNQQRIVKLFGFQRLGIDAAEQGRVPQGRIVLDVLVASCGS